MYPPANHGAAHLDVSKVIRPKETNHDGEISNWSENLSSVLQPLIILWGSASHDVVITWFGHFVNWLLSPVLILGDWLTRSQQNPPWAWYVCVYAGLHCSALPGNAPQGFNALDCGVLYVLEGQTLRNFGPVHAQADLHRSGSRHRRRGEAHNLRHGPPGGSAKRGRFIHAYDCDSAHSLLRWQIPDIPQLWAMHITIRGEDSLRRLSHLFLVTDTLGMEHCN